MNDVTQPSRGRGVMLSAVATVAALVALLAFVPLASATSDPVASGTTTVTLNKSFSKRLKKYGIKLLKVSPAKVKVNRVTLPVAGGSMDPTNGLGSLELSGGMKFKAGKKSAPVNALVLETSKSALIGKVAGKKMKVASVKGLSFTRNGFGVNVKVGTLKLTGNAAKQLNKKLGFTAQKKGSTKKNKRAAASKAAQPPFKGNQVLGESSSETQPKTVALLPSGNVNLATNAGTIKKLNEAEVVLEKVGGTSEPSSLPSPTYAFPISGGSLSPTASSGTVLTSGGLKLAQVLKFPGEAFPPLETRITLGNFSFDFAAKTVLVEVIAESNASKELNLGNLGRSSVADISLTGATVTSDPNAHTVTVQNASATLQPVAAEVLNGFSKVWEGWRAAILVGSGFFTEEEAKAIAAEEMKDAHIVAGDPLGTISFTAQTQ